MPAGKSSALRARRIAHTLQGRFTPYPTGDTEMTKKREPREVKIVHPSYQPSKAELEEDLRVEASFEEAVDALTQPVRIRHVPRPGPPR